MTPERIATPRPSRRATRLLLTAALAVAGAAGGCVRKTQPTMEQEQPPPNPEAEVIVDPQTRADDLAQMASAFSARASNLSARDADRFQRAMAEVFADLSQILPVLEGPEPSGAFRQRLRVVTETRADLEAQGDAEGDEALSPRPTINRGLRAVRDILAAFARESYFEDAALATTMAELDKSIDALDTTSGALHRHAAVDAVRLAGEAITAMSNAMSGRTTAQPGGGASGGAGASGGGAGETVAPTRPEGSGAPAGETPEPEAATEEAAAEAGAEEMAAEGEDEAADGEAEEAGAAE